LPLLSLSCAGDLSDPDRFRVNQIGAGGESGSSGQGGESGSSGQGGAGIGGGAGSSGSSGQGGGEPCDAPETVLKQHCSTGCHSAASKLGDLDLESPDLVGRLRGVKGAVCSGVALIDAEAPEKSALYDKTAAEPSCGGAAMPLGGDLLTEEERACLLDWLTRVASE
jgi:hypothetical protein